MLWKELVVEDGWNVQLFLFANGVAMEDGRRAKNGLEELMTGLDISSPPSSTKTFFVILVAFEHIPSGQCWDQN